MQHSISPLHAIVASIGISLAGGIQAQTQQNMETILLPKLEAICTERTRLIIPKGSDWVNRLKDFKTCTEKLTITVIGGDIVEIQSGNEKPQKGIYSSKGPSIIPIDTK